MVLLKNEKDTLPLSKSLKHVAIIGPHAEAQAELVGNYLGEICPGNTFDCIINPAAAVAAKLSPFGGKVTTSPGCNLTVNSSSHGFSDAIESAKGADAIVLAIGIGQEVEGESHDRSDIDLPTVQHELIKAIRAAYPDTPTVMFMLNGGMLDISPEKDTVPAILEAFYPGFWGGQAIADTLFGDNDRLGGKMPFTTYHKDYIKEVEMTDMSMTPDEKTGSPGRSYRYYTGTPVYPFGHGLSLTTFSITYESMATSSNQSLNCQENSAVTRDYTVRVNNTGQRPGDNVILAYFTPEAQAQGLKHQLYDFKRVHLEPGASTTVTFKVSPETLGLVDRNTGDHLCVPGIYGLEFTDGVELHLKQNITLSGQKRVLQHFSS